ncbi:helix-turn-helix domain-containing protein [Viridibacillus arvi]|uniref:helix-turn-helix domain-containing protein n=1 Tax=Viridibacillus arvi TaxID=263475 RepID=UPI0036CFD4AB
MSLDFLGATLKKIRKERKYTLKELASQIGVSISFLSQVERGKSNVTLESLKKISDALGVNPSIFFEVNDELLAEKHRQFHYSDLSNSTVGASYLPMLVTINPGENEGNAFSHDGHEFIFIVEGELTVSIEGQEFVLKQNESTMFDARKNHYWYNYHNQVVKFLLVSSR